MSDRSILYMLQPDQLPLDLKDIPQSTTAGLTFLLIDQKFTLHSLSNNDALVSIRNVLYTVNITIEERRSDGIDKALPHERYDEYDGYFSVKRAAGASTDIWLYSFLQTYSELLEEVLFHGTTLDIHTWSQLRMALDAMLLYVSQGKLSLETEAFAYADITKSPLKEHFDELHRWRVGHHVFLVLLQSLILVFNCIDGAIKEGESHKAGLLLDLASSLMYGSAAALRFTSDFPVQGYEEKVRPSMAPPHVEPGFSGLQSLDHQYFIRTLRDMKSVIQQSEPSIKVRYDRFLSAFAQTYEAHKFVCSRFNGDSEPSFRMNHASKRTASDVLENLKRARLRTI